MNPREFCRKPTFDVAICLTYSFDPIFFERVIIHDLFAGGATDILVVSDAHATEEALERAMGQITLLGRRYQLATSPTNRILHAKVIARVGTAGAVVLLGSNNLTAAGWNTNRELATAWQITPGDKSGARALRQLLTAVEGNVPPLAKRVVGRALDYDWLANSPTGSERNAPFLASFDEPIGSQLSARWNGRKFQSLKVMTGSTDKSGAMLRWAAREFGVKSALVAVDPGRSDFVPAQLSKLPLVVNVIPLDPHPLPHAKFAFFEGQDGCAAVVGSANCSAAAWVQAPQSGGNIESIIVYDNCLPSEFLTALEIFNGTQFAPDSLDSWRSAPDSHPIPHALGPCLLELVISRASAQVWAITDLPIESGATVELEIGGDRIPLQPVPKRNTHWGGPLPEAQSAWTLFGRLRIRQNSSEILTAFRWINDEEDLQYAVRGRKMSGPIELLSQPVQQESGQRKLVEELIAVAQALFSNAKAFPDPVVVEQRAPTGAREPVQAANPDALVRSIAELHAEQHSGAPAYNALGLPISGVMSVLFDSGFKEVGPPELVDEPDPPRPRPRPGIPNPPQPSKELPAEKFRMKLHKSVDLFLSRLTSATFTDKCTAAQLVQAAAFPLAVAVKALDGRWIEPEIATEWTFRVMDVLFQSQSRTNASVERAGLLARVRARYERDGRAGVFAKVVGNGMLWVAMAAALTRATRWSKRRAMEWSLGLTDVYHDPLLTESMEATQLSDLLSRLKGNSDGSNILLSASTTAQSVGRIEERLAYQHQVFLENQIGHSHSAGDVLWNPRSGFGWAMEDADIERKCTLDAYLRRRCAPVKIASTYFVNVRIASEFDPTLEHHLRDLGADWPSRS
jgi:hypothetical protein